MGEDARMKLTVVGCSPAWPNPGGVQSGYLVEASGSLLLDCGAGVLARLREPGGWPQVDAIAISHLHLDHFGDLVPWVFGAALGAGRESPRPELWLSVGDGERLRALGDELRFAPLLEAAFEVREYQPGVAFTTAGFSVTPRAVPHYDMPTCGFRVEADGLALAYSSDSAPSGELVELARDADLFICEATLDEPEDPGPRGHLTPGECVEAFEASGAKRLLVVHRPAERPLPAGLEQAYDGVEIELGRGEKGRWGP
jgi:ribonuclease BN (tRNA processing enzyme)